jgi:hypothetical protein
MSCSRRTDRRRGALLALAAVAALGVACGSRTSKEREPPPERAPAAAPGDAAAPVGGVSLRVDGEEVARLGVADLAARPTLASLVAARAPAAAWRHVSAEVPGGPTLQLVRPADTYADQDAVLYLDGDRPALGLFRRVSAAAPAHVRDLAATPTLAQAGVAVIDVRTREAARPAVPAPAVAMRAGDQACALDAAALAGLPRAGASGGGAEERPSWDVRDLARACFGPAVVVAAVRAPGLDVDAATLARADRAVVVKRNRRGELRVRLVDPTAGRRGAVGEATVPGALVVELAGAR